MIILWDAVVTRNGAGTERFLLLLCGSLWRIGISCHAVLALADNGRHRVGGYACW